MASKKSAGRPTPDNAVLVGLHKGAAQPRSPLRLFACPGCGAHHAVRPDKDVAPAQPLHFQFTCKKGCGYAAAVGLG